jgi:hypothetical protein
MPLLVTDMPLTPELFFDYDGGSDYKVLMPSGQVLTAEEAIQSNVTYVRFLGGHAIRMNVERKLEGTGFDFFR